MAVKKRAPPILNNHKIFVVLFLLPAAVWFTTQAYGPHAIFLLSYRIEGLLALLSTLWAGMICGISFLEAPVKFRATTLPRAIAFDVGRTVFHAFQRVETALAAIGLVLLQQDLIQRGTDISPYLLLEEWQETLLFLLPVALLTVQVFWLQPALDQRARSHMAGRTPPRSVVHFLYVAFEAIKLVSLAGVGITALVIH